MNHEFLIKHLVTITLIAPWTYNSHTNVLPKIAKYPQNMIFQILCLFHNNAPVALTNKTVLTRTELILSSKMKMLCMSRCDLWGQNINALKRCFWYWKYQTHYSVWWQQMSTQPSASDRYCYSVRLSTWKGVLSISHLPTEYSFTCLEYLIWFVF